MVVDNIAASSAVMSKSPLHIRLVQPRDLGKHSLPTSNVTWILCDILCRSEHGLCESGDRVRQFDCTDVVGELIELLDDEVSRREMTTARPFSSSMTASWRTSLSPCAIEPSCIVGPLRNVNTFPWTQATCRARCGLSGCWSSSAGWCAGRSRSPQRHARDVQPRDLLGD